MSPFTAWIMLKGLETIDLRVHAQADSALALAEALEGDARLSRVIYPGLKVMLNTISPWNSLARAVRSSRLRSRAGRQAAFRFLNALEIVVISNNLGDAKSIVTHPATTTHQRLTEAQRAELGISPGLVRLSLGLEDVEDLIADVRQALDAV